MLTKRVKYAGDIHAELLKAGFTPNGAAELLERCPDADVAPVVHGEWVEEKYQTISVSKGRTINNTKNCCSVCGNSNGRVKTSYCPHCGAKMDGGEKDAEVQA